MKNLMATTLLSIGTPMILMGDEVRRSQGGNNNAYCQDNEVSWFDWSLTERNQELLGFVQASSDCVERPGQLAVSRHAGDSEWDSFARRKSDGME
jgi:glycogen operon protein